MNKLVPYPSYVDYRDRIGIDPAIRSGKPTIRNTRITVSDILEYLAGGMSQEEILADFPRLTNEDIIAALLFAVGGAVEASHSRLTSSK